MRRTLRAGSVVSGTIVSVLQSASNLSDTSPGLPNAMQTMPSTTRVQICLVHLVVSPPLDRASSVGVPHSTPLSTCQTQNPWCLLRTLARVRERPPIVGLELFAPIISILTRVNVVEWNIF